MEFHISYCHTGRLDILPLRSQYGPVASYQSETQSLKRQTFMTAYHFIIVIKLFPTTIESIMLPCQVLWRSGGRQENHFR